MTQRNINPNPKRSLSQKKRILHYLQAGGRLTPLSAWMEIGTSKLATRISELINEDGHNAAECLRHVYNIKVDKGRNELTVSMRGLDWKEKVWGLVQNVPALQEGFESIAVSKYVNS